MGTSLNGLTPAGTYPGLIKTGDNAPIDGTLKTLSDGNGNNLPMSVSTTTINLTGTAQVGGVAIANTTQLAAKQDTLVSGTNIKTINGTSVLGSGNIVTPSTNPSGVAGAIQFSNGSAFASDASNLFWDDTNKRLGVGTNAPTNTFEIASTSASPFKVATTASYFRAIFQNSGASGIFDFNSSSFQFPTNNVEFGTSSSLGARVGIKGSGSTSATTSLLVQNSSGTAALQVRDDGYIAIFTGRIFNGLNNDKAMYFEDNIFVASNYQSVSLRVYDGTGYNSGLEVVGSGSESRVGIGTTSPNASAKLQVDSTTKGFLPPRMTTTQKTNISTPATGLVVYDTTTNKLCCYNGSTWNDLF